MIERYNYEGNTDIGFHATITRSQGIVPPDFKRKDFFDVEIVETFIAQTRLVGLFTAGNSNCILVPNSITERERGKLEDAGIDFHVLDTRQNALGNLILANDKGAMISERIREHKKEIEEALEVEAEIGEVAGLPNPGVCGAANNNGVLLHREASEEEAEKAKDILRVEEVDIGTVNMGSPYIGSGLICNGKNILVGEDTTGPEVGRIDRTLHQQQ